MNNYIEYNDKIAFHPGYYVKEIIEESGLTQEDFAKRLDTTPKNLSCLIRGEQSLSTDIALKLSRMLGTSVEYWLNLQKNYDGLIAEFQSLEVLEQEKRVFKYLDYTYFKEQFHLPELPRKTDQQIQNVREFLKVSTLSVFTKQDMTVSFRSSGNGMSESNTVRANAMVQIAINQALNVKAPKFNRRKFEKAAEYALTLTMDHENFIPLIRDAFQDAGVVLIILPNLPGSGINGATKKIGQNIMLMVNDRRLYSDTFWFTLFHEIGHIINGNYGITFSENQEKTADRYAEDKLIPPESYARFTQIGVYTEASIREFSLSIKRDPGIVLGRLLSDKKVPFSDVLLTRALRHKYKIFSR